MKSTTINNLNFLTDNNWIDFTSNLTDSEINFHLGNLLQNISDAMNISEETINSYVNNQITGNIPNQRDAISLLSTITVCYGFIFVAGILGNLITCIVISRNKSMHTATNYYLFNLAISDLILLLSGLPPEMYSMWYPMSYPFPDSICIVESTLLETATNATVLTITAFSVERYIAICHPFRQHTMSKLSRAIKFILAIWLTAFIFALPQAMQFSVIASKKGKICSVKDGYLAHVFAVSGCLFFVGPMTAICVLYVLIGIKLKKSKLLQGVKRYDLNRGISAQTRVIRMLIAVAVAFFLCWAPFHVQRLMAVYGPTLKNPPVLFEIIYDIMNYASGVMYFLSTCINPLLYNIMSHKFRNAFKLTLARQFGMASRYQTQNNNYYSALTRQNGSMRLNMTILDNRSLNRTIGPFHKRESDSSLLAEHSLINRSCGGGGVVGNVMGGRPSNRFRSISQNRNNVERIVSPTSLNNGGNNTGKTMNVTDTDMKTLKYDDDMLSCECGEHQKPRVINSTQYHQKKPLPSQISSSSSASLSSSSSSSSSSSTSGITSKTHKVISLNDKQQEIRNSLQSYPNSNHLQHHNLEKINPPLKRIMSFGNSVTQDYNVSSSDIYNDCTNNKDTKNKIMRNHSDIDDSGHRRKYKVEFPSQYSLKENKNLTNFHQINDDDDTLQKQIDVTQPEYTAKTTPTTITTTTTAITSPITTTTTTTTTTAEGQNNLNTFVVMRNSSTHNIDNNLSERFDCNYSRINKNNNNNNNNNNICSNENYKTKENVTKINCENAGSDSSSSSSSSGSNIISHNAATIASSFQNENENKQVR